MAEIYASMYLHPWDLMDEGPETVLKNMYEAGLNAVNLAVSYHSGRFLLPHNPKRRIYFAEEGVVYFSPNLSYYKDTVLKPRRSSNYKDIDVLALLIEHAANYGMKVNCWTVALHNSVFGRMYPDLAIQDLYGERDLNFLCPNNPDSRSYIRGIVKDLGSRYDLDTIQLESPAYPWGMVHGEHHELFGTLIEPVVSDLISTCFCQHCVEKAKTSGFDLLEARAVAKEIVETSLNTPTSSVAAVDAQDILGNSYVLSIDIPEVQNILRFKRAVLDEILEEARQSLREVSSKTKLNLIAHAAHEGVISLRGTEGINFRSVSKHIDGMNLVVYVRLPEVAYYHVQWIRYEVGDNCKIYAGLRPHYPIIASPSVLAGEIESVLEAGADGVDFYNYGWTPLNHFRWIKDGLDKASKMVS